MPMMEQRVKNLENEVARLQAEVIALRERLARQWEASVGNMAVFDVPIRFLEEITDPAAPSADQAKMYIRDSGGKTQLCVRFATGAVQPIATEP